ncbi:MAG: lactate permease LctP family transporter [Candidatus Accumulibacter sp.]|jgi:lactate permease|nr:lactate permease LctP family transporter [Accumulibacter sp.]
MDTYLNSVLPIVCAVAPIVWLYVSLCVLRLPGHIAFPTGLAIAAALALFVWQRGVVEVGSAMLEGVFFALWPILLVVFAAMLLFRYSEDSGGMDTIKALLAGASADRRVLALILAWGFGGFLEGIAGFGTPVLIPAAIMVALGFSPMTAVVCCLIANTTPTPFAQVGIPVLTLSSVTGLDVIPLGAHIAVQTLLPSLLLPFLIVIVAGGGVRAVRGIFLITLISALSFALPVFALAFFAGPELPTLFGSICAIAGVMAANRRLYRATDENAEYRLNQASPAPGGEVPPRMSAINACLPFLLVLVIVLLTNLLPPIRDALAPLATKATIYVGEGAKPLTFAWATPGILILLATIIACLAQGHGLASLARSAITIARGSGRMAVAVIAVVTMAKVMSYGGMTDEIAVWLVAAFGAYYPLIAPVIGMLGAFITGSDTSCAVLFGNLQAKAAVAVGADPSWITASNLSGASLGKMISPQSIAIGLGVGGLDGQEGNILKRTMKYSVVFVVMICLVTFLG